MANFIQNTLAYLARKGQTEHIDPSKKHAFQNRFEDYQARYQFASKFAKNKKILDIACGEGYGSHLLAKKAKQVIGVDYEAAAINTAEHNYKAHKNTKFVCADGLAYLGNTKDRFDLIVSFETIEHIKNYKKFLKGLQECLKPGGTLILSTPNKKLTDLYFGGVYNPFHTQEFYTNELTKLAEEVFKVKPVLYRQGPVVKTRLILSSIWTFFTNKSAIVKSKQNLTGINNVLVVVQAR